METAQYQSQAQSKSKLENLKSLGGNLTAKMNEEDLKKRTQQFGLRIIKLVAALPKNIEGRPSEIS